MNTVFPHWKYSIREMSKEDEGKKKIPGRSKNALFDVLSLFSNAVKADLQRFRMALRS